ncbi:MAG: hypothetical protein NTZ73_02670 [Candidatus Diapherotrites archaeon]|nr:hypothetical protein [Candidatus Diapherotrites archaeon]
MDRPICFGDHFVYAGNYCVCFGDFSNKEIIGFPRYIKSAKGDRLIYGKKYEKLKINLGSVEKALSNQDLAKSYFFYEGFGQDIFQFKKSNYSFFEPDESFNKIIEKKKKSDFENRAVDFSKLVRDKTSKEVVFGFGGSISLGCLNSESDIDLYLYEEKRNHLYSKKIWGLFEENIIKKISFEKETPARKKSWENLLSGAGVSSKVWANFYDEGRWIFEGSYLNMPISFEFIPGHLKKPIRQKFSSFEKIVTEAKITNDGGILQRPASFEIYSKDFGKIKVLSFVRTHSILRKGDRISVQGILQTEEKSRQITALFPETTKIKLLE